MQNVFYISVDPVIFHLGPLSIGWYGLMVALAVITVVGWLAWQNSKSHALSYDTVFTAALIGIPSGIVFSKILHVIDQFGYYSLYPEKILSGEGLTIWGAVLGATIGVWIYSLFSRHFRFTLLADMIAPGIILAQAIGRVGCTFNGCCYGINSNSPVAVIYTHPHSYAPVGLPVLPTATFEIFFDLAVFGILLLLRGKLKPEGSLFAVYFAFYAAWRLGIDFIREGTPFLFGLHQAQVIGIIILAITVPFIVMRTRLAKKEESAGAEVEA
jgi:phosphatidylglycerol---prolipoprotein diacylglyceryl transferase